MSPVAVANDPVPSIAELKLAAASDTTTAPPAKDKLKWFSESGKPQAEYPYTHLLPYANKDVTYDKLTEFEHVDPGHKALDDPNPQAFLDGADVDRLTPEFGSEVQGIQLHKLDDKGRQQLALYVAQRGVVVRTLPYRL